MPSPLEAGANCGGATPRTTDAGVLGVVTNPTCLRVGPAGAAASTDALWHERPVEQGVSAAVCCR